MFIEITKEKIVIQIKYFLQTDKIKMAALMELVSLTGLQNPTDILGIQEAHDDNNILVTYISGYIYLYQVLGMR